MSVQTQIIPVQDRQLADFSPARPEVREMVDRFKAGLKVKDASDNEYVALATLCLAHNLDPFNGEAWILPENGVQVGIKGLRKAADAQLPEGAIYNPAVRLLQHTEYERYGLDEKTPPKKYDKKSNQYLDNPIILAALCELTRSDATQLWITDLERLTNVAGDYNAALSLIGPRPCWVGVGVVRKLDKSKMELVQLAFKRAEADATKRAFNLPFRVDVEDNGEPLTQEEVERMRAAYEAGAEVEVIEGDEGSDGNPAPATAEGQQDVSTSQNDKPVCQLTGEEIYALKRDLLEELKKTEPRMTERHMLNRINDRFDVKSINEVQDTVAGFRAVMLLNHTQWQAEIGDDPDFEQADLLGAEL